MVSRRLVLPILAAALLLAALLAAPVRGDSPAEEARAALLAAVERGRTLWSQPWSEGGKSCSECHTTGPNRMRAARLKSYPKWDKNVGKVITGQQKLNRMIQEMAKGEALGLGSDDLNALEAYVSSLR